MKYMRNTLRLAAVSATLLLAQPSQAVFLEESANHFIWESSVIPDTSFEDEVSSMGLWFVSADYNNDPMFPDSAGVVVLGLADPLNINASLFVDPVTAGDANYTVDVNSGFYMISAQYFDAVVGQQLGKVRVEGWLRPKTVPDAGSTLAMLGLATGGLAMLRRRLS